MKNKQNNYDINRNIRFFINLYLYLYLFKVQFNNSVHIIGNILGAGNTYIFIPRWTSTITCKQQFDWIIKTGCDLISRKIDYLNTNMKLKNLKNQLKKLKNLAFQKNVNNKRKSVSGMKYIHFSCFTYSQ